jgi:hypothetical protein
MKNKKSTQSMQRINTFLNSSNKVLIVLDTSWLYYCKQISSMCILTLCAEYVAISSIILLILMELLRERMKIKYCINGSIVHDNGSIYL